MTSGTRARLDRRHGTPARRIAGSLLAAIAFAVVAALACAPVASSQVYGSDTHTISVQVSPITVVAMQGSAVAMSFTDANLTAGVDAMTVQDQTSRLLWGTNSSARKITAQTSLPAPLCELRLVALSPTRGNPGPEMLLGTTPQNLMLNIGRSQGNCTLRYTGTALASKGIGTENHTITFTVTTQ